MSPEGRETGGAGAEASEPAPEPPLSLEFVLPVTEAARLARFPILAALRQGRISTSSEELRWLDTPSGALADDGKLLEAPKRGPRRLIALAPEAEAPWHPGKLLPPLALLAANEIPEGIAGEGLTPLAAFSGKRRSQRLLIGDAVVVLTLTQGQLRAVAAEREVARVILSGLAAARPKPGRRGAQPGHRPETRTTPAWCARYVPGHQRRGLLHPRHRAFAGSGAALRAHGARRA